MAPVVTLLVSPAEAEALTLANSEGHIQLVLRNSTDRTVTATGGRWLRQLYDSHAAEALPAPPPVRRTPASPPPAIKTAPPAAAPAVLAAEPDQMVVIQGSKKKVETFSPERRTK